MRRGTPALLHSRAAVQGPGAVSEVKLWVGVIIQAVTDLDANVTSRAGAINKVDAYNWFSEDNRTFCRVCDYANLTPGYVLRILRDKLEAARQFVEPYMATIVEKSRQLRTATVECVRLSKLTSAGTPHVRKMMYDLQMGCTMLRQEIADAHLNTNTA